MATIKGIVRFSGVLGDLIFYQSGKKSLVRKKPGAYRLSENSKKTARDFGEASRQAAYMRKAFASMLALYAYGHLTSRLTRRFMEIFNTISVEHAGKKKLIDADLKLLTGFEFNASTPLKALLYHLPMLKIDAQGFIDLHFREMELQHLVRLIPKAEAFSIQIMVFDLGLADDQFEVIPVDDLKADLNGTYFQSKKLKIPFKAKGEKALVLALGISYFENGNRLVSQKCYAGGIAHSWHLKDGVEVNFAPKAIERNAPVETQSTGLSWEPG